MVAKNKAPKPPDYGPLIAATKEAADKSFQLGQEQLAWAKEQYAKDSVISKQVIDAALARQGEADANARKDRQRYETVFQPLEDQLAQDAQTYNTEGRREQEAGRATAAVAENFEAARKAATQNLESYGVDPSATRFAALDLGSRVQQAAASAAAADGARREVEDRARSLRTEAINVGQGYPNNVATQQSQATQSGNSGVNSALATTGSGASTMGTAPQYNQMGIGALGGWGDVLNNQYNAKLAQYNANQQSSSGIGSLLGAGLGLLGSSGTAAGATGLGMFLEDGGAIPMEASPSGGAMTDDVPARLNAGEFVIPKDVLSWKGEEFFQKLIESSRATKPQAPAQPKVGAIPMGNAPPQGARPAPARTGAIPMLKAA